jgi:hypothetical protein
MKHQHHRHLLNTTNRINHAEPLVPAHHNAVIGEHLTTMAGTFTRPDTVLPSAGLAVSKATSPTAPVG